MGDFLRVSWAFLRRDLQALRPWRWGLEMLDMGFSVALLYFIAPFFGAMPLFHSGERQDYFTYGLVGLALSQYVWRGFSAFSSRVRNELASGSLEPLWLTGYSFAQLLSLSSVWDFLSATANAVIILGVGVLGFGASFRWSGIGVTIATGLLTSFAMACLGLLTVSWMIASGRPGVLRPLLNKAIPLLSGAFFPTSVFPAGLKALAWFFPLTHALNLVRGVLTQADGVKIAGALGSLGVLTLILAAAAWGALTWALREARVNGRIAAL